VADMLKDSWLNLPNLHIIKVIVNAYEGNLSLETVTGYI
jgi:hypothetical protein